MKVKTQLYRRLESERYRDISSQLSSESPDYRWIERGAFKLPEASSESPLSRGGTRDLGTAVALFTPAVYPAFILLNDLLNKFN